MTHALNMQHKTKDLENKLNVDGIKRFKVLLFIIFLKRIIKSLKTTISIIKHLIKRIFSVLQNFLWFGIISAKYIM